jgi:hypothetical protein
MRRSLAFSFALACACEAKSGDSGESDTVGVDGGATSTSHTTAAEGATSTSSTSSATDTGGAVLDCRQAVTAEQCARAVDGGTSVQCNWIAIHRVTLVDGACAFEPVTAMCLPPGYGDTDCGCYDAGCGFEASFTVDEDGSVLLARLSDACDAPQDFERANCSANPDCGWGGTETGNGVLDPAEIACACVCDPGYPG